MIDEAELGTLRANPRFLIRELQVRGVEVELYDFQQQVFRARLGTHQEWLSDTFSSVVSAAAAMIANDKAVVKRILEEAGLSTSEGNRFTAAQIDDAMLYAAFLGFPVILKPADSSQGRGVQGPLGTMEEVEAAAESCCRHPASSGLFMIERLHSGREVRLFVGRGGPYAAVWREPASVWGDGIATITELAQRETERRMNPRRTCEGPIALDDGVVVHLARQGRGLGDIPGAGERVFLRGHVEGSGASVGDLTDELHPSIAAIGLRALQALGLPYAGFDLLVPDPTQAQPIDEVVILEANANPGLGMHLAPGRGPGRNVAGVLVDLLFPETAAPSGEGLRPLPPLTER